MPLLDSMNLSASQGNYNTETHKGLYSQYSMPTAITSRRQSYRGPASEPSQFPTRKPVPQSAESMAVSDISGTTEQPQTISTDPRRASPDIANLTMSSSLGQHRSDLQQTSDSTPSQHSVTLKPHEAQEKEAKRLKAMGNEAMVDQQYKKAVQFYTQASKLSFDDERYHCLSLRAGAHNSMGNFKAACEDAEAVIAADPRNVSAWNRLGRAKLSMGSLADVQASIDAYSKAAEYDGQDDTEELEAARKKLNELNASIKTDSEGSISKQPADNPKTPTPSLASAFGLPPPSVQDPPPKRKKPSFLSRVFKVSSRLGTSPFD